MRRIYTSIADFRQPYKSKNISFAGLGSNAWPSGRSYQSVHYYRAPYANGYYQSGALRGIGDFTIPRGATLLLFAVAGAAIVGGGAALLLKRKQLVKPALIGAGLGAVAGTLYGVGA